MLEDIARMVEKIQASVKYLVAQTAAAQIAGGAASVVTITRIGGKT